MASVNTSSIREEITHEKLQLDEQVRSGKVADYTRMLISTLLMIADMLVAIFLEESTKKGNRNSSIPSSQTEEDKSPKPRKPKDKREEHEEPFANSRTEESVEVSPMCRCEHCGKTCVMCKWTTTSGIAASTLCLKSVLNIPMRDQDMPIL